MRSSSFDIAMIGRYAWIPYCFGAVGYILGGIIAEQLMRRGWTLSRARKAVLFGGAAVLPGAIFAPFVPTAGLAIAAICLVTLGHGLWTSNLQALPGDLFEDHEVGTVTGLSGSGGAIGGILANLATGWIVQHFTYAPIFLAAGLVHPLSAAIIYAMLPARMFPPIAPVSKYS